MPKIILASKSKARIKLLKQIGLKFRVEVSGIKESRSLKIKREDLVIANALSKARDIADKFKSGIVIGADTIVLAGKKVIGKPKDNKSAFKILKLLSKKPQWVYTGLAVIDINKNKVWTAYDKTKIYMQSLSDEQIKSYFKKVSPLDKAGAFDIQGPGSIFIDRVEGCFYNVVGLPLSKLAKLLKKAGVDIL
ncbi:MAG: Maf family protein [Candidatus Omnitrophota bacterium]